MVNKFFKRILLIIVSIVLYSCFLSNQKTPDYIRIDQRGERDKPIGPLVISKEKIDVKTYEIPIVVSEEVFDQSVKFISRYPNENEQEMPEWGSFQISCYLKGKSFYFSTKRRRESVVFFQEWNKVMMKIDESDILVKYIDDFFLKRLGPADEVVH